MRPIYLASDSKARKKLLKVFGLKFKVISSGAKEKQKSACLSCVQLVKHNAQAKALAAAAQITTGVIIAADTIVSDGKRIYGKPKDLKDAQRMLKQLSGKSQWVYSGICVLDKDNHKLKTACERTRIYMDRLTDKQIQAYFKEVSPLDKAGSFDIQGKGAFFIRRIEGCFYNVVGLPLRTLYRMLQDIKIKSVAVVLVMAASAFICGCSHEYNIVTGKQEAYFYSTDREVKIGRNMAKHIEQEYKLAEDPLMQKRVSDIGRKIAAVSDRKEIDYIFKVLDEKEVNAVSLPGGYVYIFQGLIEKVKNDDELAAVIAHEVGHIVARHSVKKMQAAMGYNLAVLASIPAARSGEVTTTISLAFTELLLGYSRDDELLADRLGSRYAKLAGYNPRAMVNFLHTLAEYNRRKPLTAKSYYKTHPYVPDRIRVVKQEIGEPIDFTDYINIEQGQKIQ